MDHGFSSILERWAQFQTDNSGEPLGVMLGLGTSGSNNSVQLVKVAEQHENIRWFILLIDELYKNNQDKIDESLDPLTTRDYGFQKEDSGISVVHPETHTVSIAWGIKLPTKYRTEFTAELYATPRNDPEGPYAHGKRCRLYEITRPVYEPLLTLLQNPRIDRIFVFNRAIWNSRIPGYKRDSTRFYRGPQFQTIQRIVPNARSQLSVTENQYFEQLCEVLYILSRSGHPVFALVEQDDRELKEVPMYAPHQANNQQQGGRPTKKARRKRFQSRRRRTV